MSVWQPSGRGQENGTNGMGERDKGDEAASVKKWDKEGCRLNCLKMKKYYNYKDLSLIHI